MKRIKLSEVYSRDVHYPMHKRNPTHVESLGRGKAHPDVFKLARKFSTKIVPPKIPHVTSECSDPTLL
jgi:hypothetical protein